MSTTATATKDAQSEDKRVKEHRAAVALYASTQGATKAKHGRKVNELELSLLTDGFVMTIEPDDDNGLTEPMFVDLDGPNDGPGQFVHFVPPRAYTRSWLLDETALLAKVEQLRKVHGNESIPDNIRANAEKELGRLLEQAAKRSITIPDGHVPASA